jgi:CheY-like chemotaxis protein
MSLPSKELADRGEQLPILPANPQTQEDDSYIKPLSVLVVEDEPLIALQTAQLLAEVGCRVIGPAASVGEALSLMSGAEFDAAILDVDLDGARSFPIADVLAEEGKPFGFLTSFGVPELPNRFQQSIIMSKPLCSRELRSFIAQASCGEAELLPSRPTASQDR